VNTRQAGVPALQYGQATVTQPDILPVLKKILCDVVSPATGKHAAEAPLAVTALVTAADPHRMPAIAVPPVPEIRLPVMATVLAAVSPPVKDTTLVAVSPPAKVDTLPEVVSTPTLARILLAAVMPRSK